ncbi:MAG: NAD(P)-binding domain-containing protein [Pseudomonadota bacterium]
MSRIGIIGTGHIAAPIARLLHQKGHELTVTSRSADVSAQLSRDLGLSVAEPQQVIDTSEIVILSLRPQHAAAVLGPLRFRADQQIVSVMAGIAKSGLTEICAPASDFVQTIPLGFLQQGGCPLAAFGNCTLLASLFEPENTVVQVQSEAALNSHFAICAMVPGLLDLMSTGAAWLGRETGDPKSAEFYTSQLISGFLAAMNKEQVDFLAAERDALATEGTLSLQMTTSLREGDAHIVLEGALTAIGRRLENAV